MVNQNYVTNRLIKETVDKNQKDYVAPEEEVIVEEPTTADINVSVKNNLDEAIGNAIVTLTKGEETYSGKTGSAGGCTIKDVPFGTYNVLATADSYVDVEQQFTVEAENNNLMITFTEQQGQIQGPTFEETEEESFF